MSDSDLARMFHAQFSFQRREIDRLFPQGHDRASVHHSLCSHLISEAQELLDCEDWHFHKRVRPAERYALVEEVVDCFKWLLNVCQLHDISAREFERVFYEKTAVVKDRIRTETFIRSNPGPCLILDLDGVVCDRDDTLMWFAGVEGFCRDVPESVTTPSALRSHIGLRRYEQLKEKFYASGAFTKCTLVPGVASGWDHSADAVFGDGEQWKDGVPIVILTSRDDRKFPELHYQTMRWLREKRVPHNALIFAKDKGKALLDWCSPESIAIDDESDHIASMSLVCEARRVEKQIGTQIHVALCDLKTRREANAQELRSA